jgi:hypothetical protein
MDEVTPPFRLQLPAGMRLVESFNCREAYVYAMGQEPWLNYIMSIKYTEQSRPIIESDLLIKTCRERGIVAERLFGEKEILLPVGPAGPPEPSMVATQ